MVSDHDNRPTNQNGEIKDTDLPAGDDLQIGCNPGRSGAEQTHPVGSRPGIPGNMAMYYILGWNRRDPPCIGWQIPPGSPKKLP